METLNFKWDCNNIALIGIKQLKTMVKLVDAKATERSYFWGIVNDFMKNINEEELCLHKMKIIAKFLLNSLHCYGSSDVNHITDIMYFYTSWLETKHFKSPSSRKRIFSFLPSLLYTCVNLLNSGLLDHVIYYKDELSGLDSMHFAMEYPEKSFSLCLIKYGLYNSEEICLKEVENVLELYFKIWIHTYIDRFSATDHKETSYSVIMEFLQYVSLKHPEFPEKRPKVHIAFILKIINAVILKLDNRPITQQYVECLKQFYRIIPEPYLTRADIKDFLSFLLKSSDRKEEMIVKYLNTYVELFDVQSAITYTPRSLKHLARCVIRKEVIRNSNTVQIAVTQMCLPETLKHLLLGASE